MAWITLSLRKQCLQTEANDLELEVISLSREKRTIHRQYALEKKRAKSAEDAELANIKAAYDKVKNQKPMQKTYGDDTIYFADRTSYEKAMEYVEKNGKNWNEKTKAKKIKSYAKTKKNGVSLISDKETYEKELSEWKDNDYQVAKETYDEEKNAIKDYYDTIKEDIEEESEEVETEIDEEKTVSETQLDDTKQELQAVSDQISTDIQQTAVKFK